MPSWRGGIRVCGQRVQVALGREVGDTTLRAVVVLADRATRVP
jgi:hypothetical protein